MRSFKIVKIAVAASLTIFCFLFYIKFDFSKTHISIIPVAEILQPVTLKTKNIVFWTNFYAFPMWKMKKETYDASDLKSVDCPVTNCIITHKKSYLPNVEDYDALIFHVGSDQHFSSSDLPKSRKAEQLYIFASKE